MNLRNVTIWTTGVMLVATIIAPYIVAPYVHGLSPYGRYGTNITVIITAIIILRCLLLWLFTGSPLLVSFIIAIKLKLADGPNLILLASTIVYGIQAVYGWIMATSGGGCMAGMFVVYIAPGSLLFMIPAWIIVLRLNRHYATKTPVE